MNAPTEPAEMQISDQAITIPRAALRCAAQRLHRRLYSLELDCETTEQQVEAALWAWLIDHLDAEIARAHALPLRRAYREDFLAQLGAAQEYGLGALAVA